jgi:DNA polymerase III subunit delta'
MLNLLPWQQPQWQQFVLAKKNNRLPHALLLAGPYGIGLKEFANVMAVSLFCRSPQDNFLLCGVCKSCGLFLSGNHPDIYRIEPEEEDKQIKVEQIRELIEFINLKSQYEGYKVVLITPADNMNRSAANTLLKTLEEPPEFSLLILLSHRPNLLPITIRSRCQQIWFNPVYDQTAFDWLQQRLQDATQADELLRMSGGAPVAALELMENGVIDKQKIIIDDLDLLQKSEQDPIKVAEKWNAYGSNQVLSWLLQLFGDMLRIKSSAKPLRLYQTDVFTRLQRLTNRLDLYRLMLCHDLVLKNYSLGMGQISYNTQGLLEDFIIYWQNQTNHPGG